MAGQKTCKKFRFLHTVELKSAKRTANTSSTSYNKSINLKLQNERKPRLPRNCLQIRNMPTTAECDRTMYVRNYIGESKYHKCVNIIVLPALKLICSIWWRNMPFLTRHIGEFFGVNKPIRANKNIKTKWWNIRTEIPLKPINFIWKQTCYKRWNNG